jgi:hypothetical protein
MKRLFLTVLLLVSITTVAWAGDISPSELIGSWECHDRSRMHKMAIIFQDEFEVHFAGKLSQYFLQPGRIMIIGSRGPDAFPYQYINKELSLRFPDNTVFNCRKAGPDSHGGFDFKRGEEKVYGSFCGITGSRGFGDIMGGSKLLRVIFNGQGRFQYDEQLNYSMGRPGQRRDGGDYQISGETLNLMFDGSFSEIMRVMQKDVDGTVRAFEFDRTLYSPTKCP